MSNRSDHWWGWCPATALASGVIAIIGWSYAGVMALVGGISITEVNSGIAALVAALGTLSMAGLQVYTLFINRRRELSRKDFEEGLERRRLQELADKESLTAQLEDLRAQREADRAKADADARQSQDNQERLRQTNHDILGQLQTRTLENQELRESLQQVNQGFLSVSKDLTDARKMNLDLNAEILRLRGEIERLQRMEEDRHRSVKRVEAKLDQALGQSDSGHFPAAGPPATP